MFINYQYTHPLDQREMSSTGRSVLTYHILTTFVAVVSCVGDVTAEQDTQTAVEVIPFTYGTKSGFLVQPNSDQITRNLSYSFLPCEGNT